MVHIWKSILLGASAMGLTLNPAAAEPLGGDLVNFQDLALPLGNALGLTDYAGLIWGGIKAFKPSRFSFGTLLGTNKAFAILSGVNPSNGGLTGTITSTNGPISLKSIRLICCQSTDPTKCDQPVPCAISLTGKDAQGKKLFERSFTVTPDITGRGIAGIGDMFKEAIIVTGRLVGEGNPLEKATTIVIGAFPIGGLGRRQLFGIPITLPFPLPTRTDLSRLTKAPTGLPMLPLPTGVLPTEAPKLPGGGSAPARAAAAGALSVPRPNPTFSVPIPPMPWPFDRAKTEDILKPKLQNNAVGANELVFTTRIYELAFN
ncbi:hypothetical protein AOL_s00054g82 [Orbilia oligospora ATCC 24927]|uniref:Uncharacterized protein n=1 Tax=Arthrobotrys oligospora (strain ATCC 24927 / CBS 115.81 / DSM 1491) TaxID=756982 RepID=G1X5D8_ARTOA|nr:hypothetical protein AOL_s00054g82 [Orbilia oligospora ATCC 24927]EGX51683.1 hypothetical protein AOL_s00054g82 [Orbilia oligospora ATCC 24927]